MSATQVILLERIEKLGNMGDVVSVKPGYARNYLLPQSKALRASKENLAYFDAQRKHLEAENEKRKGEAQKLADKLAGAKVALIRQASESGQLYGSVTSRDIADQTTQTSGVKIERFMISLNDNFKTIGFFPVDVSLHPEVKVEVTINIARTAEEAEIQEKTGKALIADDGRAPAQEPEAPDADEAALEEVLEEGALEAEKEKQAEAEAKAAAEAEEATKKAEEKAAKEAEAAAAADSSEDATADENNEEEKA